MKLVKEYSQLVIKVRLTTIWLLLFIPFNISLRTGHAYKIGVDISKGASKG